MYLRLLFVTFVLALATNATWAQPRIVERTFPVERNDTIDLNLRFGDSISIKGWDEDQVSFRAVIEINGGRLNDALLIDFNQQQEELEVSVDYDEALTRQGRRGDCPDRRYASFTRNDKNGDYSVLCSDIVYEIMIPATADLNVESISSDIEITGLSGPIRAKSISGFVDLSWPENSGAELSMKTVTGEVYSGLENLKLLNKESAPPLVGYKLRGTLFGGGPIVNLESVSGNIYLRKMP